MHRPSLVEDPLTIAVHRSLPIAKTEPAVTETATLGEEAMDARLGEVWSASKLRPACRRGCSYCCTVRVAATIPEVLRIVSFARRELAPAVQRRLEERARANAVRTHGVTNLGYPPRLRCAFLGEDGACQVYAARPLVCRREHAMNVRQCRTAFEQAAPGKDHPIDRLVPAKAESDVVLEAYRRGLELGQVDSEYYELQEAAHIAFSDPLAAAGWVEGKGTFASARLNEAYEEGLIRSPGP